jgi:hypothetical protein
MNDTWLATPDPKSLLSTLAATFRTGAAVAWLKIGGLVSCAAPAAASLEFSDKDAAASLLGEYLSAAVSARVNSAWALVAAAAATAACPDGIAAALAGTGAAFACAASCGFAPATGVAKPTAADVEFVPGVAALGAADAGVAPRTATAAIACASAPVSVESAAPFAANVPGSEVARPADTDAAGAGAVFDAALSMLDARTAGLADPRSAALLINGVDPVSAALAPFEGSLAFVARAAVARAPAEGAATAVFRPAASSEGAAARCAMSIGACGASMPPSFAGAAASPAATSTAAGCAVLPADPTGAVMDTDPKLDGGSEMGGAAAAVAATVAAEIGPAAAVAATVAAVAAAAAGIVVAAAVAGGVGAAAAGAPAAGGGGGKGDGEDLPATGWWPPLESTPEGVCALGLRLGFAPASFNALAKSWLWTPIAAEFAAAALI